MWINSRGSLNDCQSDFKYGQMWGVNPSLVALSCSRIPLVDDSCYLPLTGKPGASLLCEGETTYVHIMYREACLDSVKVLQSMQSVDKGMGFRGIESHGQSPRVCASVLTGFGGFRDALMTSEPLGAGYLL